MPDISVWLSYSLTWNSVFLKHCKNASEMSYMGMLRVSPLAVCVVSCWVCINEVFPSSMTLRVAPLTAKFTALFTAQVRDAQGRGVTSTIIKKCKHSLRGLSFIRLHAILGEDCLYTLQGNGLRNVQKCLK